MFSLLNVFWKKKLKNNNIATKSYFDDEIGDFAIWNNKYNSKNHISKVWYGELINVYSGWIYACINLRANSIANLEGTLYKNKHNRESIIESDLMELIDWEFKKAISANLDLFGSCYILKETIGSKVMGFKILRSDAVVVKQTDEGIITGYTFHSWKRTYNFPNSDIIVIHTFNPGQAFPNVTNWISPAMAVAKQQVMDMMAIEYNYLFFKEGGKPGTILQTEKSIDNDEKTRIVSKWNNFFAGLRNSHKTAILDKWLNYKSTTVGQKEMEFSKQREFTREEILGMFGIGLPLLGKSDGVGFADRQVPEYYFQKYHLLPLARQIENALNRQLFNGLGYFTFGNIVSADLKILGELYDKGVISINELREAHGYKNVKDWNKTSTEQILEIEKPKEKSLFSNKDLEIFKKSFDWLKKKVNEDKAEKLWVAMSKRADRYEEQMKKEIISIWEDQEKIIIENIKSRKSIKNFIKKAEEDEDNIFSGLVVGVMWIAGKMQWILKKAIIKEGSEAMALTGTGGKFDADKLDKWIYTDVKKFWKDIDNTTKKNILKKVKEGYEAWLSEKETIKLIKKEFQGFKDNRLQMIVRTESTKAVWKANVEAYLQAGIEKKEWYTNIDARTCPHCADMHGKIIKTGDNFYNKGDTTSTGLKLDYDSILHPPLHVLCRCILLPVL